MNSSSPKKTSAHRAVNLQRSKQAKPISQAESEGASPSQATLPRKKSSGKGRLTQGEKIAQKRTTSGSIKSSIAPYQYLYQPAMLLLRGAIIFFILMLAVETLWSTGEGITLSEASFNVSSVYLLTMLIPGLIHYLLVYFEGGSYIARTLGAILLKSDRPVDPLHFVSMQKKPSSEEAVPLQATCNIATTANRYAADIYRRQPPKLYVIAAGEINCFSFGCETDQGAIFVTSGALRHLNQSQLVAAFCREHAWSLMGLKQRNIDKEALEKSRTLSKFTQTLLIQSSLTHGLTFLFSLGQQMLSNFSIGARDPRPWHAKHGHPIFALGLFFLAAGAMGFVAALLLPRRAFISLNQQIDQLAALKSRDPSSMKSLIERASSLTDYWLPPAAHIYLPHALVNGRFLTLLSPTHPSLKKRLKSISDLAMPSTFRKQPSSPPERS